MVSLLVLGQQAHIVVLKQCLLNQFEFFVLSHCVNNVLESVCSPIVTRYFDKFVALYLLQKVDTLVHLEVFNQLRAKVVAVVVRHQVWKLTIDLVDYFVDKRLLGHTKVLL